MKPFRTLPLLLALALPAAFAADPCNDTCKALVHEGQVLQAQGQNGPAYAKYKAASEAAPQASVPLSSTAVLMYTMSIEAANVQAWRFLSDALAAQGKPREAETALEAGIAADPSQRPNWSKLAALRAGTSLPLQHLGLRRGSRLTRDASGRYTIGLEEWVLKTPETPDTAMRLSLAAGQTNQRNAATGQPLDAYQVELAAWRMALKVAEELKASTGKDPSDPALLRMQGFARDGQLEPAILLLLFRQAYRPSLEAWLAAHPGGVKTFIDRYGLQP